MERPLVQLLPQTQQIRIGSTVLECLPGPQGALTVVGIPVRPLTVSERDHAVALAGRGADGLRNLALLVYRAATEPQAPKDAGLDDDQQAALEAVALHLAGASMSGGLSRTTVLVARALGGSPHAALTMAAWEADRLADDIAASISASNAASNALAKSTSASEPDDGWTTLSFETPSAGDHPSSSSADSWALTEVRDRLAERLAARARETLADLIEDLLGRSAAAAASAAALPSDRDRSTETTTPPAEAESEPAIGDGLLDTPTEPLGRWDPNAQRSWSRLEGSSRDQAIAASGVAAEFVDGRGSDPPHAAWCSNGAVGAKETRIGDQESSDSQVSDHPGLPAVAKPGVGRPAALPGGAVGDRHGRWPRAQTSEHLRSTEDRAGDAISGTGAEPCYLEQPPPEHPRRPGWRPWRREEETGSAAGTTRSRPTADSVHGPDDLALALHRAADLRGVAR